MQCEMHSKSRSCGLDTVFPDLLGRRSLSYLTDIGATMIGGRGYDYRLYWKKLPHPSPGAEIGPRTGLRAAFFQCTLYHRN